MRRLGRTWGQISFGKRCGKMKFFPIGKYNGRPIDGFEISFRIHLLWWEWKPILKYNFGEPYFIWLCFSIRAKLSFK